MTIQNNGGQNQNVDRDTDSQTEQSHKRDAADQNLVPHHPLGVWNNFLKSTF